MDDIFLGLDCSTQGFTAIIINFSSSRVIYRHTLNFNEDLPYYNTQDGIISLGDEKIVHSYPLMWVEGLELLFQKMKDDGILIFNLKAISGSGQQHGTVYLNDLFEKSLKELDHDKSLASQLKNSFSRPTSPIWMDSSTTRQCNEIRRKLGGQKSTIEILGSNTFERFSGPQIRKFYQEQPDDYNKTSRIHLVSSFLASLLLGKDAPIDHGDGAGMNLMNIKTKEWDTRALNVTAPNLEERLPILSNSYEVIGKISPYFVEKYGFNPDTELIAWSGDNPNSLIGVGLIEKGRVGISLGTSDTYFGYLKELHLDFNGEGHVFVAPTGDYMSLICYTNGSLAREKIKDKFNLNWKEFSKVLSESPPGNNGKIMLPYFFPEVVPLVLDPQVYRFGLEEDDLEGNVRGIIESQFLSMRVHSEWIEENPEEIYATGGASINKEVLQILANVFQTRVRQFENTDSAALGAALRSAKSFYDSKNQEKSWSDIVIKFIDIQNSIVLEPQNKYQILYDDLVKLYKICEDFILKNGPNPENLRVNFIKRYF